MSTKSGSNYMVDQAINAAEGLGVITPGAVRTWGELAKAYEDEVAALQQRPKIDALHQAQAHVAQLAAECNRLRTIITELTAERIAARSAAMGRK